MKSLPSLLITILLLIGLALPTLACKGKKKRGQLAPRATAAETLPVVPALPDDSLAE